MNTEIEWQDGGESVEYSRDEARVLMVSPDTLGTYWKICLLSKDKLGENIYAGYENGILCRLRKKGKHLRIIEKAVGISNGQYRCIGCDNCYPDDPDEAKCPQCGRPLDPYPHYWRHTSSGSYGELYCVEYQDENPDVVTKDGEVITSPDGPYNFEGMRGCERITAEEAEELRLEALMETECEHGCNPVLTDDGDGIMECESGCGMAYHSDIEGTPLCCHCWDMLKKEDSDDITVSFRPNTTPLDVSHRGFMPDNVVIDCEDDKVLVQMPGKPLDEYKVGKRIPEDLAQVLAENGCEIWVKRGDSLMDGMIRKTDEGLFWNCEDVRDPLVNGWLGDIKGVDSYYLHRIPDEPPTEDDEALQERYEEKDEEAEDIRLEVISHTKCEHGDSPVLTDEGIAECESGCGIAYHMDVEGTPLCCDCMEMLKQEDAEQFEEGDKVDLEAAEKILWRGGEVRLKSIHMEGKDDLRLEDGQLEFFSTTNDRFEPVSNFDSLSDYVAGLPSYTIRVRKPPEIAPDETPAEVDPDRMEMLEVIEEYLHLLSPEIEWKAFYNASHEPSVRIKATAPDGKVWFEGIPSDELSENPRESVRNTGLAIRDRIWRNCSEGLKNSVNEADPVIPF